MISFKITKFWIFWQLLQIRTDNLYFLWPPTVVHSSLCIILSQLHEKISFFRLLRPKNLMEPKYRFNLKFYSILTSKEEEWEQEPPKKVATASFSSVWRLSASTSVNSLDIDPGLKSGYLRQYSSSISVSSWSSKGCRRPRLFPLLVGDWGCGGWWGCCRGWWCWAVATVTKILVCMVCTSYLALYLKHNNYYSVIKPEWKFEL